MRKREVLLMLTHDWADWEASYAISEINSSDQYTVKTIAIDKEPKMSIGGLQAKIDYTVENYDGFDDLAMLILPGGFSWGKNAYNEIAAFVKKIHDLKIPIAAICGATIFLAKHGFLNDIKHTGDELDYFQAELKEESGYKGQGNFVSAQVVSDDRIITANETAAVDFAYEIFRILEIDTQAEIENWYDKFKNGMIH